MCASGRTTPTCLMTSPTVSCSFNAGMTTSTRSSGTSVTVSQQRTRETPVAGEQRVGDPETGGRRDVVEREPAGPHRRELRIGLRPVPLGRAASPAYDVTVARDPRVAPQLLAEPALAGAVRQRQDLEERQGGKQHQPGAQRVERQQV